MGRTSLVRRGASVALVVALASGCADVHVPAPEDEQLVGTLADRYDRSDEQLRNAGGLSIPHDQLAATGASVAPIGDDGSFVFDDVASGPAFVCRGDERQPSEAFRARGCIEIDVHPPMAIMLTTVEGTLQFEAIDRELQ